MNHVGHMFFTIGVLKNLEIFMGKHMRWSLLLTKLQTFGPATLLRKTPTQVFSCEVCEIFKKNFL